MGLSCGWGSNENFEGIVDLNYQQLSLFCHLPTRKSLKEFVLLRFVSFLWTVTATILVQMYFVLKCWIINASLTASSNPSQTTIPPSSSSAYWHTGDEMSCCPVLNCPGWCRECMRSGEERRGMGFVSGFGVAICLNCYHRIFVWLTIY